MFRRASKLLILLALIPLNASAISTPKSGEEGGFYERAVGWAPTRIWGEWVLCPWSFDKHICDIADEGNDNNDVTDSLQSTSAQRNVSSVGDAHAIQLRSIQLPRSSQ